MPPRAPKPLFWSCEHLLSTATPLSTGLTGGTWTDDTVSNDTRYYYVMTEVNGTLTGPPSVEVNATPSALPQPPYAVSATPTADSVALSWADARIDVTYNIYRSSSYGIDPATATLVTSGVTGKTFNDTSVTPGSYYYIVTSVSAAGESLRSNEAFVTPPDAPLLKHPRVYDGKLVVDWQPQPNCYTYRVYWNNTGSVSTADDAVSAGTDLELSFPGLVNGDSYFYRISAGNVLGESTLSNEISAIPGNRIPVADPGNDQLVVPGSTVQLDGNGSYDPDDNSTLTYAWELVTAPAIPPRCLRPTASRRR